MSTISARANPQGLQGILKKLSEIQIGGSGKGIRRKDLVYIFQNLTTLLHNGLSLARALETLRAEKTLKRYRSLFQAMERHVNEGSTLSAAMAQFPETFNELTINQIRIGERSGALPETIARITSQLENAAGVRQMIIKKLTYPVLLSTAGAGAMTFMMLYVVPTFENMYSKAGADLPAITQLLLDVGSFCTNWGWAVGLTLAGAIAGVVSVWKNPLGRLWLDSIMLKVPILEGWLRNIAVLQFTEVLGNLMESGFTLAEALPHTSRGIGNSVVRKNVDELHHAIMRGERFSAELEKRSDIFPPVVTQLVIVGEKTGTLARATSDIRKHLMREVTRYTNLLIGAIEPVMTIGLAVAIGGILLAVYLPMFDMIGTMNE